MSEEIKTKKGRFPFSHQLDAMDCGPACLRMMAAYYGKTFSLDYLRDKTYKTREGVSLLSISDTAEELGFRTLSASIPYDEFSEQAPLPAIAHWDQNHFVVVYRIKKDQVYIADPAHGLLKYSKKEFLKHWAGVNDDTGIVLLFEPTPKLRETDDSDKRKKFGLGFFFSYLKPYKRYWMQIVLGWIVGSITALIFPFLTQSLVDHGILNQDMHFVYIVLIAQLMLTIGQTTVEFIQGWLYLHIGVRINISFISDYLMKLMKLPIAFFGTRNTGDILQRIYDHDRIQDFISSSSLRIMFSTVNFIVFGVILCVYSVWIFLVFIGFSALYVAWVMIFLKKRRELDFRSFSQLAENQGNLIELVTGMQEIKLSGCEREKRWKWEHIQARLFKISISRLLLEQTQSGGGLFVNQIKNILLSIITAGMVIKGEMTMGMLLAVQYIIGQLNAPINELIDFFHTAQDAKISIERLGEIHSKDDEEKPEVGRHTFLPEDRSIRLEKIDFQYEGPRSPFVLKDLTLDIPAGKTTALVGASGSGKTTLIKLLLAFHPPVNGSIRIGDMDFAQVGKSFWRKQCGTVMQDGFLFSDTIAGNIAPGVELIDKEKLVHAAAVANINEYVQSLPLSYNTKIGREGGQISEGQKQRILIARAVYKDPEYIFFDEATSSLDARNEREIVEHLQQFLMGKTAVIVAHRLSTVSRADQIAVLDEGRIVEKGTHNTLVALRGHYYELVRNQLELGK